MNASHRLASAVIFATVLFLMPNAQTKAHADDFAAGNAALLDPFDPVPQIRFSDCYDRCGEWHCYDDCGYRRRCCRRHREDGDFGRRLWYDDAAFWQRIYQYDFNSHRWNDAMDRYTHQADRYDRFMRWGPTGPHDAGPDPADYTWQQSDGDHWRYWHEHAWHDDGDDDRWHDGHHDRHGDHHDSH